MTTQAEKFWKTQPLGNLIRDQWEALCDGCGKCCLNKLEDEETGDIFYTSVACHLLDISSCRCRDYMHRMEKAPHCLKLSLEKLDTLTWLPATCAYRLAAAGRDLPAWHYLVCQDRRAVHTAGMSICNWAVEPDGIDEDDLEEYVIDPALI